jgi:uncharacterized membrane-anchored protein
VGLAGLIFAAAPALSAPSSAPVAETAAQREAMAKLTPEQRAQILKLKAIVESEHPRHGDIAIPGADVVLHLGQNYYFLDAADAKRAIVEGWGNPPDAANGVLGLIIPTGKVFADSWGAVVTWNPSGWVSDKDAASANYGELLSQMQKGEEEENKQRQSAHFSPIHLVGWAQEPTYDAATHSAIWARDIQFGGQGDDTLNYDVRLLGRKGVLSLNMVASMPELAQIRVAAKDLAQTAAYNPGARYADYKPGVDKSAGYGIAGLVAAGVGLAIAKKLGFLGVILLFGKKFLVVILAAMAGAGAWFRRQWSRITGRPIAPKPPASRTPEPVPESSHQFGPADPAPAPEAPAPESPPSQASGASLF